MDFGCENIQDSDSFGHHPRGELGYIYTNKARVYGHCDCPLKSEDACDGGLSLLPPFHVSHCLDENGSETDRGDIDKTDIPDPIGENGPNDSTVCDFDQNDDKLDYNAKLSTKQPYACD